MPTIGIGIGIIIRNTITTITDIRTAAAMTTMTTKF